MRQLLQNQRALVDEPRLRVAVDGVGADPAGAREFTYAIDFDGHCSSEDYLLYDSAEIPMAVDRRSLAYLRGTVIDFAAVDGQTGFLFRNPNPVPESLG